MKKILLFVCILWALTVQAHKEFELFSPDGKLQTEIKVGEYVSYSISRAGYRILNDSPLSMTLTNGIVWGENPRLVSTKRNSVNAMVASPFYRRSEIRDNYNSLILNFKNGWGLEFRAYDTGIVYRFVHRENKVLDIVSENVSYCFSSDFEANVPYVVPRVQRHNLDCQFYNSFENTYTTDRLSHLDKERLMFLPLVVEAENGIKVCLTESDLEDFPGLYLSAVEGEEYTLKGVHAPYPKNSIQGGHKMLQMLVQERESYIARVKGKRTFPWRMAIVTARDEQLADNDLTYLLASPSRLDDISWIKPGKVAWEWWSDRNIDGVNYVTGVNNETYKEYIDFAAKYGMEYVILDEGWAVNLKADLMQVVDSIDLKELVDYASDKNVGIILWAGYYAFERDMENICRFYSDLGVKGFKVDFMDRDDQEMVEFNYRAAAMCAKYHLVLDLHGMYKPSGMNRTYPNILNFEGVHGLENMKWSPDSVDQVKYDVMVPFIRQVAGPLDYTQGAMRNAAKGCYFPCYSEPMSQGTRCRQLALYVVFESPLNMLCDTPSNYVREKESVDFISGIPTVWDETRVLDAKMGEYIVTARRKGDTWYIGGITDWQERDIELDFSFLKGKICQGLLYEDGINAHRIGRDFHLKLIHVDENTRLTVHLAPGGGFAIRMR
ncbi:glycoside hydrolase family 97 protein [Phocaeicola sp.]|uniref:glycoside hydrolase family 97 protein n=1 Tax=Phocaeicola sp. TaxID=2773926 RepID=UPI00283E0AEE|nr:glycoside hydrolase family 97 protein [Phocaeicola sp.]MDR3794202.1 glycoside hydrolase family 97 protein [Phocaeicola sp.]